MKDARGAEVNVGDTVIYFTRVGSRMDYHVGVVRKIGLKKDYPRDLPCAYVEIDTEGKSWSDKSKVRNVTGKHLIAVTGLPEVKAE